MSLRITVHRGADEIGGNCVEIAGAGTRVVLDVGLPLSGPVAALPPELGAADAILISHPHLDHWGLLDQVPDSVPVFMGETGTRLVQASRLFLGRPPLRNDFHPMRHRRSFRVGEFSVTPYLVDHSAFDAYALLIEGDGERVFYTGDLRMHGRKTRLMDDLLADPPSDIDTLITEGTMADRGGDGTPTEATIEQEMVDLLARTPGAGFLICSSQNLDRIVTAYRACLRAGRIFVIDIYTAWILRQIARDPGTHSTPDLSWDRIRVLAKGFTASRHYGILKDDPEMFGEFTREIYAPGNIIDHEAIRAQPARYFLKNPRPLDLINRLGLRSCTVVYSLWAGYLGERYNPQGWKGLCDLRDHPDVDFHVVHTSGHAPVADLARLAAALGPRRIVPVHTPDGGKLLEQLEQHRTED